MKESLFTETQIIRMIHEYKSGKDVKGICREYGVLNAIFYNWRKKHSGMDTNRLKRLKELEAENARLKRMYSNLSLDHELLKEVIEKKL